MIIRKAKVKDVVGLAKFGVKLIKYHHKLDPYEAPAEDIEKVYLSYFKKCIHSNKKLLLVAVEGDKIIGYTLGSLTLRSPVFKLREIGYIDDMFIDEEYRKNGIAQKFLDELFLWFKGKDVSNVEVTVHTENDIGKKAWAKYGFKDYSMRMKF